MERFDRETLLDLTVNVIPLVIILFFVVVFAVISPFGFSAVDTTIQFALLLGPFVALAILTYYAGKAISRDEEKLEGEAGEYSKIAQPGSEADTEQETPPADAGSDDEDDVSPAITRAEPAESAESETEEPAE
jgi:hypothetical protein